MHTRYSLVAAGIAVAALTGSLAARSPQAQASGQTPRPEVGIPVTSAAVRAACGSCHPSDDKQQMSRISFRRTTPEGWQETIRRMVSLNGARLDPAQAREVVRYLATHHGLAPEEARPADFEVLRTTPDYKYEASADIESICSRCHSMGRVISQRRTRREWELLIAMHRGYYPLVDNQSGPQSFRRPGPPPGPGPNGEPPDVRHPMDRAIDHLSKAFPLQTPEWAAWSATLRTPRLEGTWALRGWDRGKGPIYGRVTIARAEAEDEFTTETTYTYARTGETVARSGRSIVYTGFQWRGRSQGTTKETAALDEVMFVDRDWRTLDGRWFTGAYDEIGLDVRLDRAGDRTVLGVDRESLRAGASAQPIKIFGAGLPTSLQTSDVDFGPGITVSRIAAATPEVLTAVVDVAGSARPGRRDLVVAGAVRPAALAVYDKVDAIKVKPAWAMARVGGANFPKMLAQFEAHAFHNGADGRPDTPDDIDLGLVNATWSLEEYAVTYDDDDVKFVGTIDAATGLFTPAQDGPNPQRSGQRNNVGDVWAVATYTPEPGKAPLKARAHLLVTVPLYMRWEEPR